MKQVLERRYSKRLHSPELLPDLVFIDGGKGQLHTALDVFESLDIFAIKQDLRVFGISKGAARKAGYEEIIDEDYSVLPIKMDSPALLLIQQIRDEANRFAITGHRQRRAKARRTSPLERIPGLGPKKRRELLRQFGGLQGVVAAGIDDLTKVHGISRTLAETIYNELHHEH